MDVVVMPQLGETVVEGTITAWLKAVGDQVAVDDALFEVSTEKVDTEVPSAVAGVLRAILVAEGDAVPIGTPVAVITATAEEPFDPADARPAGPPPDTVAIQDGLGEPAPHPGELAPRPDLDRQASDRSAGLGPAPADRSPTPTARDDAVRSPAVRRLLAEHGLRPSDVVGSGRDGRITRNDVVAAAAQRTRGAGAATGAGPSTAAPVAVGPDDDVVELSRARLATAQHMRASLDAAAHALVVVQVDWTAVDVARRTAGVSYLPFVARAVVDALRSFPNLNASFDTERLVVHRRVHLGIAVDLEREALLVPVVHDAHEMRLPALASAITEVADLARRRRLPGDAFDGGTFTVTNVGAYGTVIAAPIINQPQVAILSTDGVRMTPVAVRASPGSEGEWGIAVRPVGNLSLSFDHRAVDGAYAAAFLAEVRDTLQDRDWSVEVAT
jgi:2-oxoglutarate dehydrogenase E2 component (dihydrolipoamide succinyltransferase)